MTCRRKQRLPNRESGRPEIQELVGGLPGVLHGKRARKGVFLDRIVIDPNIRFGKPTVRGTRITVGDVLSYLASGMSKDQILADFPSLQREDILACLAFAADRERRLLSVPAS